MGLESRRGPHPYSNEPSRFRRKSETMGCRRSGVSRLSQLSGIAYSRSLELLYSFLLIPSFTKGSAGDQAGVEPFHPELNLSR